MLNEVFLGKMEDHLAQESRIVANVALMLQTVLAQRIYACIFVCTKLNLLALRNPAKEEIFFNCVLGILKTVDSCLLTALFRYIQ